MSRRTAEASKAIRQAWQKEQERVLSGKGTRDWTPEQQQDIIDKGKAYDADGKAFEGQHMKSAEKYPEYQGDPDNIQFLTKKEHLDAHRGNWQNPTNWYYDPVTYEFTDFGEGKYIPCTVIDLSHPIITISVDTEKTETKPAEKAATKEQGASPLTEESKKVTTPEPTVEKAIRKGSASPPKESQKSPQPKKAISKPKTTEGKTGFLSRAKVTLGKAGSTIASSFKTAVEWGMEHKELIGAGIAFIGTAATSILELTQNGSNSEPNVRNTGSSSPITSTGDKKSSSEHKSNPQPATDTSDKTTIRSSPCEHEVSGHSQKYHTKKGVVVKEKKPYSRGRNKSNDE